MVTVALIIVTVLLFVSLAAHFMNGRGREVPTLQARAESEGRAREALEAELSKKKRELEEQKTLVAEAKDQLKQLKRKNYEQRESDKAGLELVKAREAEERKASAQLESVRVELAHALAEVERLKAESDARGGARRAPPPAPVVTPAAASPALPPPPPAPAPQRVIRELSEADKERMQRLEQQAAKDRARAAEAERETKRIKGKVDTQSRLYVVAKGELDLLKDKYKALEKRLNRTLLERDLMQRAIADLERQTGQSAGRTQLSAEEAAESDRSVDERQRAEARALEEARVAAEAKAAATREAESTDEGAEAPLAESPAAPAAPAEADESLKPAQPA